MKKGKERIMILHCKVEARQPKFRKTSMRYLHVERIISGRWKRKKESGYVREG